MQSDAQSNYGKSLGKLLEQVVTSQGHAGGCLMVELVRQNQRLRDLHAALAAATFGAERMPPEGDDEAIVALLAQVGQSARVSGVMVLGCESPQGQPVLCPVHRWGSAVRLAGQMPLDLFASTSWRQSLLVGEPVVGDLKDFDSEQKLSLVPLGIAALAAIPVMFDGDLAGVVVFEDTTGQQQWNDEETAVLRLIAWSVLSALTPHEPPAPAVRTSAFPALEAMGSVAVVCLEADRRVSYWSCGAEKLFGYAPEEVVGKEWVDLVVPGSQRELMRQAIDQAFLTPSEGLVDLQLVRKDGQSVHVRAGSHVEQRDDGQAMLHWVGMDISELHEQHEAKVALNRQMLDSRKMETVGHLIGGLAHHTNNALTVIQGNAELIRMHYPDDSELQALIGEILNGVKDAAGLTTRLQAYSQSDSHDRSQVDVHDVIRRVAGELRGAYGGKPVMTLALEAEVAVLPAARTELEVAIASLIENACEATTPRGEITISTETVDFDEGYCALQSEAIRPGSYLCVTVDDTGCGMDNQTLQRAFEPFFSTKEFGQGHGLGLANVYGCVRNHKGTVLLTSTLGRGTTVQIFLPISLDADVTGDAPAEVTTTASKGRLVVIEDEDASRETLEAILTGAGYQVTTFKLPDEALAYYRQEHASVDALAVDMHLPQTSGREVFAEIRRINPDARCLLSSRLMLASDAQAMLDAGAEAFLAKPYNADAVLRQISKALPR